MKINELKGYKKDSAYDTLVTATHGDAEIAFKDFISKALQHGWELKGTGKFGTVLYKSGKDYVYKVYRDEYDTYRAYAEWARRHQANPFVPKVGKVIKIPGTDHIYANKIEILKPLENSNDPKLKKYIDRELVNKEQLTTKDEYNPFYAELESQYFRQALKSLYFSDKNFKQVIDFVYKFASLDLHSGNVMWRGDQLVITDPVAFRHSF
jgi:hypothetical protein